MFTSFCLFVQRIQAGIGKDQRRAGSPFKRGKNPHPRSKIWSGNYFRRTDLENVSLNISRSWPDPIEFLFPPPPSSRWMYLPFWFHFLATHASETIGGSVGEAQTGSHGRFYCSHHHRLGPRYIPSRLTFFHALTADFLFWLYVPSNWVSCLGVVTESTGVSIGPHGDVGRKSSEQPNIHGRISALPFVFLVDWFLILCSAEDESMEETSFQRFLESAQKAKASGKKKDPWSMIHDPWFMIHESMNPWIHDSWSMIHDPWSMIHDSWSMIHDPWSMIHDPWFMIHESMNPWFMIHESMNPWFMIHDPWSMIHDPWSMIHDPWSMIHDPWMSSAYSACRLFPSEYAFLSG